MAEQAPSVALSDEDVLQLNTDTRVEVIDSEAVEMAPVGFLHTVVAGNIYDILRAHVNQHGLGYVASDSLIYVLARHEDGSVRTSRIPDVSFIRKDDFPKFDLSKPFPGAPALAVEVVSPFETAADVDAKLNDLFAAGTQQIWVAYPNSRKVYVYDSPQQVTIYTQADAFTSDTLFRGLQLTVRDFFTIPPWMLEQE